MELLTKILAVLNNWNVHAVLTDNDFSIHDVVEDEDGTTIKCAYYCTQTVTEIEQFEKYCEQNLSKISYYNQLIFCNLAKTVEIRIGNVDIIIDK